MPFGTQEMWQEYHRERHDAMAKSIPAQQFQLLKDRAKPWYGTRTIVKRHP